MAMEWLPKMYGSDVGNADPHDRCTDSSGGSCDGVSLQQTRRALAARVFDRLKEFLL
jgi:hypothetical protein